MNLFHWMHVVSYQRRSLAARDLVHIVKTQETKHFSQIIMMILK